MTKCDSALASSPAGTCSLERGDGIGRIRALYDIVPHGEVAYYFVHGQPPHQMARLNYLAAPGFAGHTT